MTLRKTKKMSETKAPKATSSKTARVRAASVSEVIRCGFSKCTYTAKQMKTVERHRQKEHNVDPDVTHLDSSISTSILDDTAVVSETDNLASSLEHKTSSEFYSDMSKVEQSTQIEAESRRRKRNSDSEEEGEDEKRLKMQDLQTEPVMTQSPGKEERDNLCKEVLAALKAKTDKENLDVSTSLLDDTRDVGTNSDILNGLSAGDEGSTQSLLMTTAQETISPTNQDNVSQQVDSLGLNMTEQDNEVRNLEDQLALRTRSLEDALATNAQLKTDKATAIKKIEYWEGKAKAKDKEIQRLSGIIKALKEGLAKPTEAVAAKDAKIVELTTKVQALKKKCEEEKEATKRAKESAEGSRALVDGFIITQAEHKSQLVRLKRRIPCEEDDCPGEKECGFHHKQKEENKGQCKYFNYGKCDRENECTYKHDIGARKLFHEEKKKLKEEKEKEKEKAEEKKNEEKKEESKGDKAKESDDAGVAKRKKKKNKGGKGPKTEPTGGKSTAMETDEVPAPPPSKPDAGAKPDQQQQVNGAADHQQGPSNAQHPQHDGNPQPQPPLQPPLQPPQHPNLPPRLQPPQIPTNFNFGQQQFPTAPPTLTPTAPTAETPAAPSAMMASGPPTMTAAVPQPQGGNGFQGGASWHASWSGPSQLELEAAQASRKMRLDAIRMQLNNVQLRLMTVHNAPPGTVNVNDLLLEEMKLKQNLYSGNF